MRLPELLEPVRRCRFCKREMLVSGAGYAENPFCRVCLPERIAIAATDVEWRPDDHYLVPTRRRES